MNIWIVGMALFVVAFIIAITYIVIGKVTGSKKKLAMGMIFLCAVVLLVIIMVLLKVFDYAKAHGLRDIEDTNGRYSWAIVTSNYDYGKFVKTNKEIEIVSANGSNYLSVDSITDDVRVRNSIETFRVSQNDIKEQLDFNVRTDLIDGWLENKKRVIESGIENIMSDEEAKNVTYKFVMGDHIISISEKMYANQIDYDSIKKDIINYVNGVMSGSENANLKIDVKDYITSKVINEADYKELQKYISKCEKYCIKYSNGEVISVKDYLNYMTIDSDGRGFHIDKSEEIQNVVKANIVLDIMNKLSSYNTTESDIETTINGEKMTLKNYGVGSLVDYDAEAEDVLDMLNRWEDTMIVEDDSSDIRDNINRTPELSWYGSKDDINNNYILINIEEQTMECFKDGKSIIKTSVVTGTKNKNDTPKGVFTILERKEDTYLTGRDYRSHVDYWLRITWQGVGIHDATWRSKFGGKIYESSGSHGCINTPHDVMEEIYKNYKCYNVVVII